MNSPEGELSSPVGQAGAVMAAETGYRPLDKPQAAAVLVLEAPRLRRHTSEGEEVDCHAASITCRTTATMPAPPLKMTPESLDL